MFSLSTHTIEIHSLQNQIVSPEAGAVVTFEGRVRNHDGNRSVLALEYECYEAMALCEGQQILQLARERFDLLHALCVHRAGYLTVGEVAVWVGVSAVHRGPAFEACQFIIDTLKSQVPIWKKEYYAEGDAQWVFCPHCATSSHTA